ncbi:MAG: hypothetical protein ACUVTL_04675 [Thermoproteota archaeon]
MKVFSREFSKIMPSIGVYICHCGTNIAGTIDVKSLREYSSTLKDVVVSRDYTYVCSEAGQDLISKDIQRNGVDRVSLPPALR